MGYEIYQRTTTHKETEPTVSIGKLGRIGLNRATTKVLRDHGVERVLLMWDKDRQKIGLRPIAKKDSRAYSIIYGRKDAYAMVSGKSFLAHIGYDTSESRTYSIQWNEAENMLELDIPAQHLRKDKTEIGTTTNIAELKQKRG